MANSIEVIQARLAEIAALEQGWFDGDIGEPFDEDLIATCSSFMERLAEEFDLTDIEVVEEPDCAVEFAAVMADAGEEANVRIFFDFEEGSVTLVLWKDTDDPIFQIEIQEWDYDIASDFIQRITN